MVIVSTNFTSSKGIIHLLSNIVCSLHRIVLFVLFFYLEKLLRQFLELINGELNLETMKLEQQNNGYQIPFTCFNTRIRKHVLKSPDFE